MLSIKEQKSLLNQNIFSIMEIDNFDENIIVDTLKTYPFLLDMINPNIILENVKFAEILFNNKKSHLEMKTSQDEIVNFLNKVTFNVNILKNVVMLGGLENKNKGKEYLNNSKALSNFVTNIKQMSEMDFLDTFEKVSVNNEYFSFLYYSGINKQNLKLLLLNNIKKNIITYSLNILKNFHFSFTDSEYDEILIPNLGHLVTKQLILDGKLNKAIELNIFLFKEHIQNNPKNVDLHWIFKNNICSLLNEGEFKTFFLENKLNTNIVFLSYMLKYTTFDNDHTLENILNLLSKQNIADLVTHFHKNNEIKTFIKVIVNCPQFLDKNHEIVSDFQCVQGCILENIANFKFSQVVLLKNPDLLTKYVNEKIDKNYVYKNGIFEESNILEQIDVLNYNLLTEQSKCFILNKLSENIGNLVNSNKQVEVDTILNMLINKCTIPKLFENNENIPALEYWSSKNSITNLLQPNNDFLFLNILKDPCFLDDNVTFLGKLQKYIMKERTASISHICPLLIQNKLGSTKISKEYEKEFFNLEISLLLSLNKKVNKTKI